MAHALALANRQRHEELVAELKELLSTTTRSDSGYARARHISRGKLLPRQHINQLLDPGSPFLEVAPLAAHEMYGGKIPAAGVIAGIGIIENRRCLVVANDAAVSDGTYYPLTIKKHPCAQKITSLNHLPCIYLVDSGGAVLLNQDEVFPDRGRFGRILCNQASPSTRDIPRIAAMMGPCAASGAYVPAMSDEAVIMRDQGTVFLAGPPLVKVATGEDVTPEELSGGELHSKTSGATDYLAVNGVDALYRIRGIVATLPKDPEVPWGTEPTVAPARSQTGLYDVVPVDAKVPYDVHEVVEIIVDGGRYQKFKVEFGTTLVIAFTHIHGHHIGIVANSGILFAGSAQKGAHFTELCGWRGIPLIFLQNTTGSMVGREYEASDIAKYGAKMVNAVATTRVPRFAVVIGGAFGAGSYSMCGHAYSPRFLWMWLNACISIVGGPQVAMTLPTVRRNQIGRSGESWSQEEQDEFEAPIRERSERQSHCYYSPTRLRDDDVVDPTDTRRVLGTALDVAGDAPLDEQDFGVFRM